MAICFNAQSQLEDADPLLDRGFLLGDGAFETLRVEQGKALWFDDHFQRLTHHALTAKLSLPWQSQAAREFLENQIPDEGLYRCRLSMTAGEGGLGYIRPDTLSPRLYVNFSKSKGVTELPQLLFCPQAVPEEMSSKTLSCMDRILFSPPLGQDWVMYRENGFLTEATMSNIFFIHEGKIKTPKLNTALLSGLTRLRVLKMAQSMGLEVLEGDYHKDLLLQADEIFLTGTVVGIVAVRKIDEKVLGDNPVTSSLQIQYQKCINDEISLR